MMELFYQGGTLFMSILSVIALMLILAIIANSLGKVSLNIVRELGLLALVFGILGQLIGLYQGFNVLEEMGGPVSPALLMGGLKVSMITTLYGMIIYIISLIFLLVRKAS